ncbi:DNA topoisomerase 6 subunit B [Rubripirellula amarantea]|uniref:DNA topoisomerase 6 subunit B n=1 Tax=Rubripirellula amarantea TaxID=2527999 RepID=A0A5C5WJJ2_9BACT|nr:ATP-binding protein [Rubripirellula amarantea]TWT50984.1 DNA topoisomerase 6 subunit B [Rubripirellula amarantea]
MNTTIKAIPMVLAGQALNSLRDSGYDLATALGEPVDNSLEANANLVQIRLDQSTNDRGKKHIHQIVIADDGDGMNEDTLWHYLQLGYSSRYMSKKTIGKYGVGAKLAALNFARRIDVWSRTADGPWRHVYFDLDEVRQGEQGGEVPGIAQPEEMEVPAELKLKLPSSSGTIVVWSKVDRLEDGRRAPDANELRLEVEKELSRIFRYFLHGGRRITVNETDLVLFDPLMSMDQSWADQVLSDHYSNAKATKGAKKKPREEHFGSKLIWEEPVKIEGHEALVRITLYPREVLRKRGTGGDKLAKKLRLPENEGKISFVRLDREVSYTNVPRIFGRAVQEPDRFIGIEVSFTPELDDYFGIRNVKRGVEPHGELRERIRTIIKKYVTTARKEIDEVWGAAARDTLSTQGEHASILDAAKNAGRTLPSGRAKGPESQEEKDQLLDDLARDVVGSDVDKEKERLEYIERLKELPFVVESVDFPGTQFVDIQHVAGKVLIRLNTRHRFYREMWAPVREIASLDAGSVSGADAVKAARRTIEALTLMMIAFGKAESMHEDPQEQYGELRSYWGQFLSSLMGKVKDIV